MEPDYLSTLKTPTEAWSSWAIAIALNQFQRRHLSKLVRFWLVALELKVTITFTHR